MLQEGVEQVFPLSTRFAEQVEQTFGELHEAHPDTEHSILQTFSDNVYPLLHKEHTLFEEQEAQFVI